MPTMHLGASVWDPDTQQLTQRGKALPLTALETRLVAYLAARARRTVDSQEQVEAVWNYAPKIRTRAVASTVTRLRAKLGDDASAVVTVYGRGYRLEPRGDDQLVGRQALIEQLTFLLRTHRWVTLYGLGGAGKTRVAQAVLRDGTRRALWVPCGSLHTESDHLAGQWLRRCRAPGSCARPFQRVRLGQRFRAAGLRPCGVRNE